MPKLTVLAIMAAASLSATVKSMMLSRSFGFTPQIELSECGYGFSPCVIAVNRFLLGKASSYDINFVISTVTTKLNQVIVAANTRIVPMFPEWTINDHVHRQCVLSWTG